VQRDDSTSEPRRNSARDKTPTSSSVCPKAAPDLHTAKHAGVQEDGCGARQRAQDRSRLGIRDRPSHRSASAPGRAGTGELTARTTNRLASRSHPHASQSPSARPTRQGPLQRASSSARPSTHFGTTSHPTPPTIPFCHPRHQSRVGSFTSLTEPSRKPKSHG